MTDQLATLSTILLAISLATERLIAIIKTIFPKLAEEQKDEGGQVDNNKDMFRRLLVQIISFTAGWVTAALLTPNFELLHGHIKLTETINLHVILVGFLSMGGSAFWSSIIGYTKAVKDTQQQRKKLRDLKVKNMTRGR